MEDIKKIWINEDGTPIIVAYNGSWNVIKHEGVVDNIDYSICIWDTISEHIFNTEKEFGRELSDEEYVEETSSILQYMADSYGFELIKE